MRINDNSAKIAAEDEVKQEKCATMYKRNPYIQRHQLLEIKTFHSKPKYLYQHYQA